ncbi:MAG: hypothetical protein R3B96_06315 [Pirellulaceae bacterium]
MSRIRAVARTDRIGIALTLFAILLVLMTTGVMDTLVACGLIAVAMVATGCSEALGKRAESVEWQVLIAIAAAFGVGTAIDKGGATEWVAGGWSSLESDAGRTDHRAAVDLLDDDVGHRAHHQQRRRVVDVPPSR